MLFPSHDFQAKLALPSMPLNYKNGGFSLERYQKIRFAGTRKKLFQEWLSDIILGGILVPKSPKKGSKTPKNHIQDNIITNSIFH